MTGQLCWMAKFGGNGDKTLHLRLQSNQPWKSYTLFPGLAVPDYPIPGGSKGWATSQKLLQAGWTLIPSHQVQTYSSQPPAAA